MAEWAIALAVAVAAYLWGRRDGELRAIRWLAAAIRAGRSPQARALNAVLQDKSISNEVDR